MSIISGTSDSGRIRQANSGDSAELYRLNAAFNGSGCTTPEGIAARLRSCPDEIVVVAETNCGLAGFCCGLVKRSICYDEPSGELTELYVEPAYRRKGIAAALVSALEEAFRAQGVRCVQLLTGGGNAGAQALYTSCGYDRTDEVQFEKEDIAAI